MHRRYNLVHLVLIGVVITVLTPLMVDIDAQAQIAFVSHRAGNPEIYVMAADGDNQRRFTNHPDKDWTPSWSPDGKRIAFASNRDGQFIDGAPNISAYEIYVMDADGGNLQNLTNNPNSDTSPSWSPDGKHIAFASWDGQFIDFVVNFEIYVMDADGNNPQNLTNNPNDDRSPSWSPDGERIVFVSERPGHFRSEFGITSEIYVMDADGGNQGRLTENRQNDWNPSWSPDGKRIAFASDRKGDFENFEIYVMDTDGDNQQKLTNQRGDDRSPSWSPDGERIVFSSDRDGNAEIYVMAADGGNPQNLTNNRHDDVSPAWLGPGFTVAPAAVAPAGKKFTMWGRLKQVDR